jgi:hypothetical protein
MKIIHKSFTGMCADAKSVFPTWQTKHLKQRWLKDAELFIAETTEGEIICTQVAFLTDYHQKQYMMDAITGTCYRKNGSCLTSDHLKILNLRSESGLDKQLMSKKSHKLVGG